MIFLVSILTRYSSAGEAFYVGAFSGFLFWGAIKLIQFIKNRRKK